MLVCVCSKKEREGGGEVKEILITHEDHTFFKTKSSSPPITQHNKDKGEEITQIIYRIKRRRKSSHF